MPSALVSYNTLVLCSTSPGELLYSVVFLSRVFIDFLFPNACGIGVGQFTTALHSRISVALPSLPTHRRIYRPWLCALIPSSCCVQIPYPSDFDLRVVENNDEEALGDPADEVLDPKESD